MYKRTLGVLVLAGLVAAACGAAAAPLPAERQQAESGVAPLPAVQATAVVEAPAGGAFDATGQRVTAEQRIVIKNASLSLLVKDTAASADEIANLAEEMGGWVVSTNVYESTYGPNAATAKYASITIRVPADRMNEALTKIKAMAVDVESENVSGQDVTSEYTDLQSRLRNLEAAEKQLQQIMDEATKTEDVLAVYNQLVSVREQIEVIKGQIKYYEESAAFSEISVQLTPDVVAQPIDIGGWRPEGVAKDAFELLIRSLQALVNILIYLGICGVPFTILFILPAFLVVRWAWRKRKQAKEAAKS